MQWAIKNLLWTTQLFCGKMTSLPSFNLASQTRYKGPTLYLVFLVIVIAILAMFTFQFCPKLQDKHCKEHYDYDRENQMQSPSLNKHRTGKLGTTFQLKTTGINQMWPFQLWPKLNIRFFILQWRSNDKKLTNINQFPLQ